MREELKSALLSLKAEIVEPCEECGGAAYFEQTTPGALNPCRCMTAFYYLSYLVEARIPRDYWWLSLDDLDLVEDKYKEFVWYYLEHLDKAVKRGLGVMFLGKNGTGKTSMQCAIGKEAVVQGYRVRYFTAQQYIEAGRGNTKDSGLLDDYESADVILLDEVDKVYIKSGSDYVPKTIEEFLRRMVSANKVVIACTNYTGDELTEAFGTSTVSMLQRHLRFVGVEGEDFSEQLQANWKNMLEEDTDFYDERIMSMAKRLWDREQEEYTRAWENPND